MSRLATLACLLVVCSCRGCGERHAAGDAAAAARGQTSCGHGQQEDPARAVRIRALLAGVEAGRGLWARAPGRLRICFIETGIASLSTDGVITLDRRAGDAECAARLGHLLLHAIDGAPLPAAIPPSRSCDLAVRHALEAEARAHALELTLRRQLGVPPRTGHPFEAAFWAAPAGRRVELLRAHFVAHPEGGPGLPGYVNAYTRRCREMKQESKEEGP